MRPQRLFNRKHKLWILFLKATAREASKSGPAGIAGLLFGKTVYHALNDAFDKTDKTIAALQATGTNASEISELGDCKTELEYMRNYMQTFETTKPALVVAAVAFIALPELLSAKPVPLAFTILTSAIMGLGAHSALGTYGRSGIYQTNLEPINEKVNHINQQRPSNQRVVVP